MSNFNYRVKCDLHKNRPIAYIASAASPSIEEIAKTIFYEWNLHESFVYVNVISDSNTFTDFGFETKRQQIDKLKTGFRKLLETDVRRILFTSGRTDDPAALAAGRAALELAENASYSKDLNGSFDESTEDESDWRRTTLNFKLIAVNKIDRAASGEADYANFDENHTHLIIVDDVNTTTANLMKLRMELMQYFSSFAEEKRNQGDDQNDERYVSLPVNTFYEVPRSRLSSSMPYMINLYFGIANDDFQWLVDSLAAKIPLLCFENASDYANFLSFARTCTKRSSLEKRFNTIFSLPLKYALVRQNIEKFNDTSANPNMNLILCFDIMKEETNLEKIALLVARMMIQFKEKMDSRTAVRFLIQMNAPCLLNNFKLEANFVDSYYFYEYFEEVLTNPKKECFVEWFLNGGIRIDRFLTFDRLIRLFKNSEPRDFFHNVVLGSLLGYVSFPNDITKFVKVDLKELFYHLSFKMIKFTDITFDIDALKSSLSDDSVLLEKHCFDILIFWSAIMKRNTLVRLLWSYAYDPLPLALVLAEIFKNLEKASFEFFVYAEDLRALSRYFKDCSVELLNEADLCAPRRSYDVLCYGFEQYSNVTATHLAYLSENRRFIAHIWCQRWLNRLLFGNLKICKLEPGFATAPPWLKIVMGAMFVFPIKLWIKCPPTKTRKISRPHNTTNYESSVNNVTENNVRFRSLTEEVMVRVGIVNEQGESVASDNNETSEFLPNNGQQRSIGVDLPCSNTTAPHSNEKTTMDLCSNEPPSSFKSTVEASFCTTVYQFYNAPITKYWLHLIFRLVYLILFGLALSMPKCGIATLDLIIWLWSFIDWVESLWVFYLKRKNGHGACRTTYSIFDILTVASFLFLFISFKIVSNQTYFLSSSFTGRIVAALFLLYKCYSTLFTYLPMHSTLGPLLIRVRLMICRDFVNFLILISLIVASFAVVIHATIYPDYPADSTLWARAFKRAWFTLFLTPVDDLNEENRCKHLTSKNPPYCNGGAYLDPSCPTVSPMSYIVVIQYLILIKLIAWPILFALFGKTAKEIDDEADIIWKYQFYCMVTDFSLKPALPPPLTPLAFLFLCCFRFRLGLGCFQRNIEPAVDHPDVGLVKFGTVMANEVNGGSKQPNATYYSFWRSLARCLYEKLKNNNDIRSKTKSDDIVNLHHEIAALKKQLDKLNEELQSHN